MFFFSCSFEQKLLVLLLIAVAGFTEVHSEDKRPVHDRTFWQVTKKSLQVDDDIKDANLDKNLLIVDGTKLFIVTDANNGLSSVLLFETSFIPKVGRQKGSIRVPGSRVGKDGQVAQEVTEYPVEIEIHKQQDALSISLNFSIEKQRIWYEAIQFNGRLGKQELKGVLDSGLVCSPSVRKLLVQMID